MIHGSSHDEVFAKRWPTRMSGFLSQNGSPLFTDNHQLLVFLYHHHICYPVPILIQKVRVFIQVEDFIRIAVISPVFNIFRCCSLPAHLTTMMSLRLLLNCHLFSRLS